MSNFNHRHGLQEAGGFKVGQRVSMLVETKGDDHESVEHTMPSGSRGIIECIEILPHPQCLTFTIWIPIDEEDDRGIVNVFDESDGPILSFFSAAKVG
jgi:hypothetical protein